MWTYIAALHFAVASVVGNDTTVQAFLPREMVFTIFVHVVAFLITAFFTASVVSLMQSFVRRKHEFAATLAFTTCQSPKISDGSTC